MNHTQGVQNDPLGASPQLKAEGLRSDVFEAPRTAGPIPNSENFDVDFWGALKKGFSLNLKYPAPNEVSLAALPERHFLTPKQRPFGTPPSGRETSLLGDGRLGGGPKSASFFGPRPGARER